MKTSITCTVNGEAHTVLADTRDTLLDLLREQIGLTGSKEGCGNGNCGTCTVLVDGTQWGFCTPGIVLSAKALLDVNPQPTTQDVRHAIAGNICRCTGYDKIVDAVMSAAATMQARER
jgi:carbon-monoxide dehydrogenase small subunit